MRMIRYLVLLLTCAFICVVAHAVIISLTVKKTSALTCEHVAMLGVENKIFVAYNPHDDSHVYFLCSKDGGESFQETGQTISDGFNGTSMAFYNGQVYIGWGGGGDNRNISIAKVILDKVGCPTNVDLDQGRKMVAPNSTDAPVLLFGTDKQLLVGWMNRPDAHLYIAKVNFPNR
jgi:hypothetical protein